MFKFISLRTQKVFLFFLFFPTPKKKGEGHINFFIISSLLAFQLFVSYLILFFAPASARFARPAFPTSPALDRSRTAHGPLGPRPCFPVGAAAPPSSHLHVWFRELPCPLFSEMFEITSLRLFWFLVFFGFFLGDCNFFPHVTEVCDHRERLYNFSRLKRIKVFFVSDYILWVFNELSLTRGYSTVYRVHVPIWSFN